MIFVGLVFPIRGRLRSEVRCSAFDQKSRTAGAGVAPSSDYSMYEIRDGRITAVIKDQTLFGCPNREYHRSNQRRNNFLGWFQAHATCTV